MWLQLAHYINFSLASANKLHGLVALFTVPLALLAV